MPRSSLRDAATATNPQRRPVVASKGGRRVPSADGGPATPPVNNLLRLDTLARQKARSDRLRDPRHDVLDLRVVLERVHGHVLAVPGLLVAAVRHLGDEWQ